MTSIFSLVVSILVTLNACNDTMLFKKHPKQYEDSIRVHNSKNMLAKIDGKWALLDSRESVIIPALYDTIVHIIHDVVKPLSRFIVKVNGHFGIVDRTNKYIVQPRYESISNWIEYGPPGYYVQKDSKHGIVSYDGGTLIPPEYDSLYFLSDEHVIACKNGLLGIIDLNNNVKVDFSYRRISDYYGYTNAPPDLAKPWFIMESMSGAIIVINDKYMEVASETTNGLSNSDLKDLTDPSSGFRYIQDQMLQ